MRLLRDIGLCILAIPAAIVGGVLLALAWYVATIIGVAEEIRERVMRRMGA